MNLYRGDGTIKTHYEYDSWGRMVSITDENGNPITAKDNIGHVNPIRYRGYYYDSETGLYYLKSRYYDPELGRFLNCDNILDNRSINTFNPFVYCASNPINNIDSDGHFFFGALVGGIIGGATGALSALVQGKSVTAGFLTGAVTGAAIGLVCDSVATGGISAVAGVALCGVVAGIGNVVNQYSNYKSEKNLKRKCRLKKQQEIRLKRIHRNPKRQHLQMAN